MAILCTNWNATAMPLPTGIKQAIARDPRRHRNQINRGVPPSRPVIRLLFVCAVELRLTARCHGMTEPVAGQPLIVTPSMQATFLVNKRVAGDLGHRAVQGCRIG
jgi:hypothetical protein